MTTKNSCTSVIQTKENEICYSEKKNDNIYFYDLNEKKIKSSISNINKSFFMSFIMITEDLLLIPGENKISIINVNQYQLIRKIDVPSSGNIFGVCMLNKNMLLTGDCSGTIRQWKIEGDNLISIYTLEKAHKRQINALVKTEDGHIASASKEIKIWLNDFK